MFCIIIGKIINGSPSCHPLSMLDFLFHHKLFWRWAREWPNNTANIWFHEDIMRQKLNVDTLICIIRRFFSDLFPEADIRVGMVVTLLRQKVRLLPNRNGNKILLKKCPRPQKMKLNWALRIMLCCGLKWLLFGYLIVLGRDQRFPVIQICSCLPFGQHFFIPL